MIFNDAFHVQVEEGGEDGNAKNIGTLKVDDCLRVMHDVISLLLLCINNHN
jgi:hypothetical protein